MGWLFAHILPICHSEERQRRRIWCRSAISDAAPIGADAHIGPPAQSPQICHSEERKRRRISMLVCSEILRFAQNERWGDFHVSTGLSSMQAFLRHSPPHRECAGRAERGNAHGSVRRGRKANFGGRDSKGKGGFVKSPSLWRAFLPLLSARAERRGPRRAFPCGG